MKALQFRVQNYRNIDDSGWITLDRVTAFVGRNESGKTALLKALHKFNPGQPEAYDPQRDFPRDRYTRDYIAGGSNGADWPAASIEFEIPEGLHVSLTKILGDHSEIPGKVVVTRHYDDSLEMEFEPPICNKLLPPDPLVSALGEFAASARRLELADLEQEQANQRRQELATWPNQWKDWLTNVVDLNEEEDALDQLIALRDESDRWSSPETADMVEALLEVVNFTLDEVEEEPVIDQLEELVESNLPVLIYFEDYGILDSAVWLTRFIEDLERAPDDSRVRTVNAMFAHVGLDPSEITELGHMESIQMRLQGQAPTQEQIGSDQRRIDERAVRLNSASTDISRGFSEWWSQRRHKIRYHADGDYFRIWVTDDRRPDVEIELEARSKGFQWFFSFYLVFLVESDDGYKDAILLLDEPGLHLHGTAQQELISFFERLSETNQLLYTTHSPFLIDGDNLHRVRPVTEDETGHSRITAEEWPKDRETIFPLQAAAGYAMIRGLFQHRKNLLVEGMGDFYYLQALSMQCARSQRTSLPDDIYITPCGGTKYMGHLASLFLGHDVRPLVLLDGDDAGRARQNSLLNDLYTAHSSGIVMLDDFVGRSGQEVEIEDLLGEDIILEGVEAILGRPLAISSEDRSAGSIASQIQAAAERQGVELPRMWKGVVALRLVSSWAQDSTTLSDDVLDTFAALFSELARRFQELNDGTRHE